MAIKIGGTSIIDDNKNISNVGVVTVGTGGTNGRVQVGTGATIDGSGNVSIAGTIYALDISVPLKIDSFDPSNNATNVSKSTDIKIYFNKAVGLGTTGFIEIKNHLGTLYERFNIGAAATQVSFIDGSRTLVINPVGTLQESVPGVANTIVTMITREFLSDPYFTGLNTSTAVGPATSYRFSTETVSLGGTFGGGRLICTSAKVAWVAAPVTAECSTTFDTTSTANTAAQAVSGCTGWFVPPNGISNNPGYVCRTYWDTYSLTQYWTSSFYHGPGRAWAFDMNSGTNITKWCGEQGCVRSFRCVTY